ncbi:MAG: hypothetical protein ACR2NT_02755 [Acidimicrobiia bacterium]
MIPRRFTDRTGRTSDAVIAAEAVTGADPAASAEFSITVPTGERWLLTSVSVPLVQGITQTPWPRLIIDDGTNDLFASHSGTAAQAASTTCQHSWSEGTDPIGPFGATTNVIAQGTLPEGFIL